MSDELTLDAEYLANGPTFASWIIQPKVRMELQQQYSESRAGGEDFEAWTARMFVARHGIWNILNDPNELVQRAIDERIQQLRMGVKEPAAPLIGALTRNIDEGTIEPEDLDRTDDVDEHLLVYESAGERNELASVMAEHAEASAEVGRYSGDTGGTRIITAEVYAVIDRLHKMYEKDPVRSKRDRSKRSIAREIQQDLLMRWEDFGLKEPVAVSDVTIDKIIRGVYESQLRYGIPSEEHFLEWEKSMKGEAGDFKKTAWDHEARKAFHITRQILIAMALENHKVIPEAGAEGGGLLEAMAQAKGIDEFQQLAEKYLVPLFRKHNVDFPLGWTALQMQREVLYVAMNLRYPQDVMTVERRTMFRTFTPDQLYRYTRDEEIRPPVERQRPPAAPPPV